MESKPQIRYRKLQIAWSVAWGILAVMICAMWVRSFQTWDSPHGPVLRRWELQLNSVRGYLLVGVKHNRANATPDWRSRTFQADRFTNDEISGSSMVWRFTRSFGIAGFGAVESNQDWQVYVPYWFLSLIPVACSFVPIRWFARYRLRTLLIATTLVAVVLGLVMWAAG